MPILKFKIRPEWSLKSGDGGEQRLRQVFELLTAISAEGNLNRACNLLGVSYRHAWGLVRQGGSLLGAPLVSSGRGQRAQLTALGEKLVWANKRIAARLTPVLNNFALELESELEQAMQDSQTMLRVRASHAFAIAALQALSHERGHALDLRYVSSSDAVATLGRGACDMAGFHIPLGEFEPQALDSLLRWLDPRQHVLIHLVVRHQGLIVAAGNPARIAAISDLAQPGIRFVNRQAGSGTRLLLDLLFAKAGLSGAQISGFDVTEYTHSAVAAYIASGMADAGFGVETAARHFQLGFVPLVNERYFLVCRQETLDKAPARELLATLQGSEFRSRLADIPGIDSLDCGNVLTLGEAFPVLATPKIHAVR